MSAPVNIDVIGHVESPYGEKFGVPRQPGLASSAKGVIHLCGEFANETYFREIEQFSHIWLIFLFHQTMDKGHKALVRPPRLGGNSKVGVFATRSTFRPNPIGMSVVKLDHVEYIGNKVVLHVSELDLVNGTPLIDIKPYLPYSDCRTDAIAGLAPEKPQNLMDVAYQESVKMQLKAAEKGNSLFRQLVCEVLSQDPRPAYKKNKPDDKVYTISLDGYDVSWVVQSNAVLVTKITPLS